MRFDFAAMGPAAGTSELRIEPPQHTPLFLTIFCLDIVRIPSPTGAYSMSRRKWAGPIVDTTALIRQGVRTIS